jgi:hypothetical protein
MVLKKRSQPNRDRIINENSRSKCFIFILYETLACGFGGVDGGAASTGAGTDGDEIVFESAGLLLFEDFRSVRSAFGAGVPAESAAGGAIGSGFGFVVLISCVRFVSSCSSFAKSFFLSGPQSDSSAFRPATSHCISLTFALPSAIAVRRPATFDST